MWIGLGRQRFGKRRNGAACVLVGPQLFAGPKRLVQADVRRAAGRDAAGAHLVGLRRLVFAHDRVLRARHHAAEPQARRAAIQLGFEDRGRWRGRCRLHLGRLRRSRTGVRAERLRGRDRLALHQHHAVCDRHPELRAARDGLADEVGAVAIDTHRRAAEVTLGEDHTALHGEVSFGKLAFAMLQEKRKGRAR